MRMREKGKMRLDIHSIMKIFEVKCVPSFQYSILKSINLFGSIYAARLRVYRLREFVTDRSLCCAGTHVQHHLA